MICFWFDFYFYSYFMQELFWFVRLLCWNGRTLMMFVTDLCLFRRVDDELLTSCWLVLENVFSSRIELDFEVVMLLRRFVNWVNCSWSWLFYCLRFSFYSLSRSKSNCISSFCYLSYLLSFYNLVLSSFWFYI